jgi:hypothetical protein
MYNFQTDEYVAHATIVCTQFTILLTQNSHGKHVSGLAMHNLLLAKIGMFENYHKNSEEFGLVDGVGT